MGGVPLEQAYRHTLGGCLTTKKNNTFYFSFNFIFYFLLMFIYFWFLETRLFCVALAVLELSL